MWTYMQKATRKALRFPDQRIFKDLGSYFKLALPLIIMIVLDQWVWEFMLILAGRFSVLEQNAQIILM